jgi:hypothetical protein
LSFAYTNGPSTDASGERPRLAVLLSDLSIHGCVYRLRRAAIAWLVRNERSFTENVAGMEFRKQGSVALDIRLALDNKVNLVAKITVREDGFPRLKMLAAYCVFVKQAKLRDIAWQEDVENPVRDQAKLTVESWKLRDVNTTPQQPGDEAFESKTERFRDR